jgi:hypothetical protein
LSDPAISTEPLVGLTELVALGSAGVTVVPAVGGVEAEVGAGAGADADGEEPVVEPGFEAAGAGLGAEPGVRLGTGAGAAAGIAHTNSPSLLASTHTAPAPWQSAAV